MRKIAIFSVLIFCLLSCKTGDSTSEVKIREVPESNANSDLIKAHKKIEMTISEDEKSEFLKDSEIEEIYKVISKKSYIKV